MRRTVFALGMSLAEVSRNPMLLTEWLLTREESRRLRQATVLSSCTQPSYGELRCENIWLR